MDNGADSYRRFRDEGDEQGLVEIIRDYKNGLILYLNSMVGNITLAEELAEDTFVLLGTKKPRDKRKGSFKAWLYTIGRHIAVDYLRRQARRREVPLETAAFICDEIEAPEAACIRQEQQEYLRRAMALLKPDYRQALWLIYYEGFSQRQVAAVMKKSVHSVETLVYRARKALKLHLETEGFAYEEL